MTTLLAPSSSAPASAASAAPSLERLEPITSQAFPDSSNGGNGWGSHAVRVERTSTDDIFATYPVTGSSDLNRQWVLAHRAATGGWSTVAQAAGGREPVDLLRQPQDMLRVVGWPGGLPTLGTAAGGNGTPPFATAAIAGNFQQNDWPYHSAATNARGDLFVVQSGMDHSGSYVPGLLEGAYRTAADGQWHSINIPTAMRYLYTVLLPNETGGLDIVGTSGVTWGDLGYTQPPSTTFGYVNDRVHYWHTDNLASQPFKEVEVAFNPQPAGSNAYVYIFAYDAYRDTQGRVHIMYSMQGPSTGQNIVGHHAILENGAIVKDVTLQNVWCPDTARIIQDTTGQFDLITKCGTSIYVWPADSVDGTQLGSPTTLDVSQYPPSSHLLLATPRGGSPVADYVDGVYPANNDGELVYFRIRLRTSAPPPPVTPPPATNGYRSAVLADGPAAYWRLDEATGSQAADASGHGKSGTYSSTGVTRGVAGALTGDPDTAASFDGASGAVAVTGVGNFTGTSAFSAEAWVNPSAFPANVWGRILSQENNAANAPGWSLYVDSSTGTLSATRANAAGADWVGGSTALPLNKWSHVVLTYDGSTLRLYLNGQPLQTVPSTRGLPTSSAALEVAGSFGAGQFFSGRVDEPAVYSKALSAGQVLAHYNAGSAQVAGVTVIGEPADASPAEDVPAPAQVPVQVPSDLAPTDPGQVAPDAAPEDSMLATQ